MIPLRYIVGIPMMSIKKIDHIISIIIFDLIIYFMESHSLQDTCVLAGV